jgi:spore germination protein YaaH
MRRLVVSVAILAIAGGGSAVALASRGGSARAVPLPAARRGTLQVVAFTDARPSPAARGSLSAHLASLGAISPDWLTLGPNGTIAYRDADAFSQSLAARGAAILPVLRDPQGRLAHVLATGLTRHQTALRLASMLRALSAQGIVLDLGNVPARDRAALPAFLRTLRAALPPTSRILLVVPPVSDARSRRAAAGYDLRDLARPATLVLRAWRGNASTSVPHPVASLGWFKRTVRYTLAQAPRARVIIELPTWGTVWGPNGTTRASQTDLFRLARPAALDQPAGTEVVRAGHVAWVESDRSLQLKLEVARAAKVAGVALWVRGGESTGVWREPLIAPPTGR